MVVFEKENLRYLWIFSISISTGYGFRSGSCYFRLWPSRCHQKVIF